MEEKEEMARSLDHGNANYFYLRPKVCFSQGFITLNNRNLIFS